MKINHRSSIVAGAVAFVLATSCCWLPFLAIGLGGVTGLMAFSETLERYSLPFLLLGSGLLVFGIYQMKKKNQMAIKIILSSTITCPNCGHQKTEQMPTDACQYFYECEQCHQILKPKEGDCCVFCSYGTVDCPPIQEGKACC